MNAKPRKSEWSDLVAIVERELVHRWGKNWRAMLSVEMQVELARAGVMRIVCGWCGVSRETTAKEIQAFWHETNRALFPEQFAEE